MTRTIQVAALQLPAGDRADFPKTQADVIERVKEAADADLVVLPEGTLPAYVLGNTPLAERREIERTIEALRVIARDRKTVIVIGITAQEREALRNRALIIDSDGSIAGHADKVFLWHFDRKWFEPGEEIAPVQTAIGTLGVLICADGRIPTIARALVDRGAEILVMPTAWVTSGRDEHHLENPQADLLARVRAFENGVPFVAANKCGVELGMVAYCGKSQIINSLGEVVAMASEREPEIVRAEVTVDRPHPYRNVVMTSTFKSTAVERPIRIAISTNEPTIDLDGNLSILDAQYAILPDSPQRLAELAHAVPVREVHHDDPFDPGYCAALRRTGCRLLVWNVARSSPWIESVARVRALELRIYVVVLDMDADRAFAVDPDGAIVAGTFGDYRLASFTLDPYRMRQTSVAPGTDVVDGLERALEITQHTGS